MPSPAQISIPVRVYYEDTDAGGIVYHAAYLRFMERARTDLLRQLGFAHQCLGEEFGVMLVVESMQLRFIKPALLDDMLQATARVARAGRASAVFDQTVRRGDVALVEASVRIACLDAASRRPAAMPAALERIFRETA